MFIGVSIFAEIICKKSNYPINIVIYFIFGLYLTS